MSAPRWSDERIASLRLPKKGKSATPYNLTEGLALRVYPSGVKSFGYVERNAKGNPQFRPFAKHGMTSDVAANVLTVADARIKLLAVKLANATAAPVDPALDANAPPRDADGAPVGGHTFRTALKDWITTKVAIMTIQPERKHRYKQTLTDHFCDQIVPDFAPQTLWGELKVEKFVGGKWEDRYETTLLRVQQREALGGNRRGPCTLAHQTDVFARKFFKYLVKCGYMKPEHKPTKIEGANEPRSIERALSIAEVEKLFAVTSRAAVLANPAINEYDAVMLRLLLITGLRVNSLRLMCRSMRGASARGFWTVPAETLKKTKTQTEAPHDHLIPITPLLAREVARLDDLSGNYDYLFIERYASRKRARGEAVEPLSDSWAKHLCDEHAATLGNTGGNHYTAHAFRRTQSNTMLEFEIPEKVIDLCHARIAQGTAKTYLTAKVRDQVCNAFEQWSMFLTACEHGKGDAYIDDLRDARTADKRAEDLARMARIGLPMDKGAAL
jgi:integrase